MVTMDDESFMSYVYSHSRTPRHAFHSRDVNRMEELAGADEVAVSSCGLPGFFGVDEYEADRLIAMWKARKKDQASSGISVRCRTK